MLLSLHRRIADRARWELREWRTPSVPSFAQEELDRALLQDIRWSTGERVLDVGCADGAYLAALTRRGLSPTGLDVSLHDLGRAVSAGHKVLAASGLRTPFADAAFDTILCHKTMYLFTTPPAAVHEFCRILRPGGRVIFSTSNMASPYARMKAAAIGNGRHTHWACGNSWSVTDWCRAFAAVGLRVRAVYSCNLVWPLVYRVCDRWLIPNEWMRRYNRWIRRASRMPLRTDHPHGAAMDYVVELAKTLTADSLQRSVRRGTEGPREEEPKGPRDQDKDSALCPRSSVLCPRSSARRKHGRHGRGTLA